MKQVKILILITIAIFLSSCGTVKKGFQNQKKNSSDEFLVEKKSPLVLPPKFGDLPLPNEENIKEDNKINEIVLGNEKFEMDLPIKNSDPTPLEKSVLEKIK